MRAEEVFVPFPSLGGRCAQTHREQNSFVIAEFGEFLQPMELRFVLFFVHLLETILRKAGGKKEKRKRKEES